jgi:hypothetical protein
MRIRNVLQLAFHGAPIFRKRATARHDSKPTHELSYALSAVHPRAAAKKRTSRCAAAELQ